MLKAFASLYQFNYILFNKKLLFFLFFAFLSIPLVSYSQQNPLEYEKVGRIPTPNNMGWIHPVIDPITEEFLNICNNGVKVLEIGASYGHASEEALVRGASVWINDLDIRQLEIFQKNIKDKSLLSMAEIVVGDFPDSLELTGSFYDAILAVRVFHFFDPEKLNRAAKAAFVSLKAGGRIYIVAESPYLRDWSSYTPIYERKKAAGDPYPGYFTNLEKHNKINARFLPKWLHFLDPEVLTRVFKNAGFNIEIAKFMNRTDYPENARLDGRESVGLIAIKP